MPAKHTLLGEREEVLGLLRLGWKREGDLQGLLEEQTAEAARSNMAWLDLIEDDRSVKEVILSISSSANNIEEKQVGELNKEFFRTCGKIGWR